MVDVSLAVVRGGTAGPSRGVRGDCLGSPLSEPDDVHQYITADDTPPPPPDPAVVRDLLATLPLHSNDLRVLPAKRLRQLLESLHLAIRYDHKEHSAR